MKNNTLFLDKYIQGTQLEVEPNLAK